MTYEPKTEIRFYVEGVEAFVTTTPRESLTKGQSIEYRSKMTKNYLPGLITVEMACHINGVD